MDWAPPPPLPETIYYQAPLPPHFPSLTPPLSPTTPLSCSWTHSASKLLFGYLQQQILLSHYEVLVRLPVFLSSSALDCPLLHQPVYKIHINLVASIFYQLHFLSWLWRWLQEIQFKKKKKSSGRQYYVLTKQTQKNSESHSTNEESPLHNK